MSLSAAEKGARVLRKVPGEEDVLVPVCGPVDAKGVLVPHEGPGDENFLLVIVEGHDKKKLL